VVEGYCDESVCGQDFDYILDAVSGQPTNCRLPKDKVGLKVEVEPANVTAGSFVPVRVSLTNSPRNSRTGASWTKDLYGLEAILRLDAGTAYVLGTAVLQGGTAPLIEEPLPAENMVIFRLGTGAEAIESGLPGNSEWVLDLMLLCVRDPSEAVFSLDVWAPCGSTPLDQVGCHDQWDPWDRDTGDTRTNQQLVSNRVQALLTGGDYEDDRVDLLQSPVLGCQCGTEGRGGWGWLLLLLIAGVLRKYRP
jgi:MYXO-CTERM domain-containing protein